MDIIARDDANANIKIPNAIAVPKAVLESTPNSHIPYITPAIIISSTPTEIIPLIASLDPLAYLDAIIIPDIAAANIVIAPTALYNRSGFIKENSNIATVTTDSMATIASKDFLASLLTSPAATIKPDIKIANIPITVTPFSNRRVGTKPIATAKAPIKTIEKVTNNIVPPIDKALPLTSPMK